MEVALTLELEDEVNVCHRVRKNAQAAKDMCVQNIRRIQSLGFVEAGCDL